MPRGRHPLMLMAFDRKIEVVSTEVICNTTRASVIGNHHIIDINSVYCATTVKKLKLGCFQRNPPEQC